MIEILVTEIAKYDMVQILQKAEQGEKVVLVHNGDKFGIMPYTDTKTEITHNKNVHLSDLFEKIQVHLPSDYKFDREEANAR